MPVSPRVAIADDAALFRDGLRLLLEAAGIEVVQFVIGETLVDIVVLWLLIGVTIWLFRPVSRAAAWLLVPYWAWVTFATALNAWIWLHHTG